MFTDIIKSDALRRQNSLRPSPGSPTSWMTPSIAPPPGIEQMMQVLQQSPGMTPELLRMILNDRKYKMANQPVFNPNEMVSAANYRNPL